MTDKTYKLSGIKYQHKNSDLIDSSKEEFDRKGFVVIKNIFNPDLVRNLQSAYTESIKKNHQYYSEVNIEMTKREQGIIRQIYRYDELFLDAITKPEVTDIVDRFLDDDWLITQQNGSHVDYENLSKDSVGVQVWHRDFVFRHVTTSKPILINILVPLDEFTVDSGATNVLPYSHLFENFPSNDFLLKNLTYAEASPGDIIVLNGLTYHSAGQNLAGLNRRSFNTVFAVPLFRHQVEPFPERRSEHFDKKYGKFLTAGYANNPTILEYLGREMHKISELLLEHYAEKFSKHGATSYGVDWGDPELTQARQKKMLGVIKGSESVSLLDVGCGYGDLANLILRDGLPIEYSGIEIVTAMVDHALGTYKNFRFHNGDFLVENLPQYDYIVCNGILTQKLTATTLEMNVYAQSLIRKMYSLAKIGVAFNVMNTHVNFQSSNLYYRNPTELMSWCTSELTPHIVIDSAYQPWYEYTVYLYKPSYIHSIYAKK